MNKEVVGRLEALLEVLGATELMPEVLRLYAEAKRTYKSVATRLVTRPLTCAVAVACALSNRCVTTVEFVLRFLNRRSPDPDSVSAAKSLARALASRIGLEPDYVTTKVFEMEVRAFCRSIGMDPRSEDCNKVVELSAALKSRLNYYSKSPARIARNAYRALLDLGIVGHRARVRVKKKYTKLYWVALDVARELFINRPRQGASQGQQPSQAS